MVTLNKHGGSGSRKGTLWQTLEKEFTLCLYRQYTDSITGAVHHTHAEPEDIINSVNSLIKVYSNRGTYPVPIISKATEEWWAKQIEPIRKHRILSHPRSNDPSTHNMASSMLENYHKHLNRLMKVVKFSKPAMHCFLGEYMFRWNVDRRRAHGLEHDWVIYDFHLLHESYTACERVLTREVTLKVWPGKRRFCLPEQLVLKEEFGLDHANVSLEARMQLASSSFPFDPELIGKIVQHYLLSSTNTVELNQLIASTSSSFTAGSSTESDDGSSMMQQSEYTLLPSLSSSSSLSSLPGATAAGEPWDTAAAAGAAVAAGLVLPPVSD